MLSRFPHLGPTPHQPRSSTLPYKVVLIAVVFLFGGLVLTGITGIITLVFLSIKWLIQNT